MIGTAEICDKYGDKVFVVPLVFSHFGGRKSCEGQIRTVEIDTDNSKVIAALEESGDGRVLFISSRASGRNFAVVGDKLASIAIASGWSGIVLDGAVRDVALLRDMPLCIVATHVWPVRGLRNGGGAVGLPLNMGGQVVKPDMHAFVDEDGILISNERLP